MSQDSKKSDHSSKQEKDNIDLIGNKWALAPYGHRVVNQVKAQLIDLSSELQGYSTLFTNLMQDPQLDQNGLYGIGLSMKRFSRRLEKAHDRLAETVKCEGDIQRESSRE